MPMYCPGPSNTGCPKNHYRGPRGGRCKDCQTIRRKQAERVWQEKRRKDPTAQRRQYKVTRKVKRTEEVTIARSTKAEPYGIKEGLRLIDQHIREAT